MARDDTLPETNKAYAIGLARAFGGAIIFAIPLLMTMEMWSLGFTMGRGRLLLFLAINFAILVGLSYFAGFEKTFSWKEDALDAFAAFGVGAITSAAMLALFGVVTLDMTWSEIVGKVALQSVPASLGAMLGRKQLGAEQDTGAEEERKREAGYGVNSSSTIALSHNRELCFIAETATATTVDHVQAADRPTIPDNVHGYNTVHIDVDIASAHRSPLNFTRRPNPDAYAVGAAPDSLPGGCRQPSVLTLIARSAVGMIRDFMGR